jgi:hypothetical protein
MGELVLFRPRDGACRRLEAEACGAEILFFTGVRIVRLEDVPEPPKIRRRRNSGAGKSEPSDAGRRETGRSKTPRKSRELSS